LEISEADDKKYKFFRLLWYRVKVAEGVSAEIFLKITPKIFFIFLPKFERTPKQST